MPFYEMIMLCKVGESQAMATLVKNVSTTILQQGGVVRGIDNLGDRVISKTMKAQDGMRYGIGRYIQVEFTGTPKTLKLARDQAMLNTEILQTFAHKIKDDEYLRRTLKRLNQELSPLKDESTKDPYLIRDLWTQYVRNAEFQRKASADEIRREPELVHAYLKRLESGADNQDAQTITKLALGEIDKSDVDLKNYLIKQYQKKKFS
eukprot:403369512